MLILDARREEKLRTFRAFLLAYTAVEYKNFLRSG